MAIKERAKDVRTRVSVRGKRTTLCIDLSGLKKNEQEKVKADHERLAAWLWSRLGNARTKAPVLVALLSFVA